jgi:aryl-alcohol dehydrogenase-like predicted oxidoreductase
MQFTKFGQTGLTVSRMILGTGTFGKQTDEKEAHRMLDKAAEAGINFIDTADVYPPGAEAGGAEIITGRWLSNKRAGFILPQRAAEKWGLPLGMQATHENTCSTPSTLRYAA